MAAITINIPDDKLPWVVDGFAKRFKRQDQIANPDFDPEQPVDPDTNPPTIDNPEGKGAFAKRMLIHMIKHEALKGHNQDSMAVDQAEADTVELS